MAYRIEGITYPDRIADILDDRVLLDLLKAETKDTRGVANMLRFLTSPPKPGDAYDLYLGPNASHRIDLSRSIATQVRDLAEGGEPGQWVSLLRTVTTQVERAFDDTHIPAFFKSRRFLDHHNGKARAKAKKTTLAPRKVADTLGVRSTAAVEELMIAVNLGRDREADQLARKLIQSERLNIDRKKLLAALRRGKIPADGLAPDKVEVTAPKLRKCGFEKAADTKLQEAVTEFAQACLAQDKILIRIAYKKIRKIEPAKEKIRDQADSNAMIKVMRQHKVF
ncbi:hypothetical protein [Pontivivens ytuae]|uniref:Uncharacterized protein n=1 Tax=Pontivivens ytuae TaxID=2789856 RepID=A0A7S9QBK9_9RHOB|nr:hypothetical protein [Pontivivens ytuae]QPH52432.1 hypothetical protein I0K15_11405 [Pontivivens ytuae]